MVTRKKSLEDIHLQLINIVENLFKKGKQADMVEIRKQTRYKYSGHSLSQLLVFLRKRGLVKYVRYKYVKGNAHGHWIPARTGRLA